MFKCPECRLKFHPFHLMWQIITLDYNFFMKVFKYFPTTVSMYQSMTKFKNNKKFSLIHKSLPLSGDHEEKSRPWVSDGYVS